MNQIAKVLVASPGFGRGDWPISTLVPLAGVLSSKTGFDRVLKGSTFKLYRRVVPSVRMRTSLVSFSLSSTLGINRGTLLEPDGPLF